MIVSVHSNDVMFWHAVTGDVLSKKSSMGGDGDVTSALLDDRNRKLLVGDSQVSVKYYMSYS